MQIRMEGRQAANEWKSRAESLNNRTQTLLNDVSNTLKSVRELSEGSLVDEIVALGDSLLTATTKLMQSMNAIFDVVNKLLNFLEELISGSSKEVQAVKSFVS